MAELLNLRLLMDCDLTKINQVYRLEKPIKLALYNAIKCGQKNPCAIRPFGIFIGTAEAIITIAIRLAMIVEDLLKGIADIAGSLVCIEKCRLLRGLFQIVLIVKDVILLPFFTLYGILELVRTTLHLAFNPKPYIEKMRQEYTPSKVVRNLSKDFENEGLIKVKSTKYEYQPKKKYPFSIKDFEIHQEELIEVYSQQELKEKHNEFFSLLGDNKFEEAKTIIWKYFKEERDPFLFALATKQMENNDSSAINTIKNMSDSSQWAYLPLCIIGRSLIEQDIVEPLIYVAKTKLPEDHLLNFSLCFEIAYPQHKKTLREKIVIEGENGKLLTQLREQEEGETRRFFIENHKKIEESTKELFEEFKNKFN